MSFNKQTITLSGEGGSFILEDPDALSDYFSVERLDPAVFQNKANSFSLPSGRDTGNGWVLIRNNSLKLLVSGMTTRFSLTLIFENDGDTVTIQKLDIASAQTLVGTEKYADDGVALVHLVDARSVAHFSAIDKAYNVRSYRVLVTGGGNQPDYYEPTLNAGVPWTWTQMIDDLWSNLPGVMLGYTNSATFPDQPPENYVFRGLNAWDALCKVLDDLDHTVYRNLNGAWTIAPKGAEQVDYYAATDRWKESLDQPSWLFPSVNKLLCVPSKVKFYFPTVWHAFQNETNDSTAQIVCGKDAWLMRPVYAVTYTTSTDYPQALAVGGSVAIHDSRAAYYDETGAILNEAELTARANKLGKIYISSKRYAAGDGATFNAHLHPIYIGFHSDFTVGPLVSAVSWSSLAGSGPKTEILLSPLEYRVQDDPLGLGRFHVEEVLSQESVSPPDIARNREPATRILLVETYDAIESGNYGLASVQYGMHGGVGLILWSDSGKKIELHNPWENDIPKNKKVLAFWHDQTRRWICSQRLEGILFKGTLNYPMCPDDKATTSSIINLQTCETIDVTELPNPLKLAGEQGDMFIAFKDCEDDEYKVLQVQHKYEEYIRGDITSTGGCSDDGYGTLVPNFDCKVRYSKRKIAVMWCQDPMVDLTLINTTQYNFLVDWRIEGYNVIGTFLPAYVMCACDPYDEVLAVGTECQTSSSG